MRVFYEKIPLFAFVTVIFILGVGFGAVAVKTVDYGARESLFSYFNNFMEGYNMLEYDRQSLVSDSIKFNLINLLIIWGLGISVFLMPLITVILFFKGFVLGFTVGFLISEYSYAGILIALSTVFPQNMLIIPAMLMAGMSGFYFSIKIIQHYRGRAKLELQNWSTYTMKMLFFGLLLLGGSLVETFISPVLFKYVLKLI